MAIDLNQGWSDASDKINSFKTTKDLKENENDLKKSRAKSRKVKSSKDTKKQKTDATSDKKENIKNIKSETKNQLELLLELFKESLPKEGGKSLSTMALFFLNAANETKNEIANILVDEIISTIGCSEEQSYDSSINQPFYIKVNQIDLFNILKTSYDDENGKYFYESSDTLNGTLPYSMNRQLYKRLQNLNQPFSQDQNSSNGQNYIGASQSPLFDIEYVQNYTNQQNVLVTGDFFKITLNSQLNNGTKVSEFLKDYFSSIDILSFDLLSANLKNLLTGSFDFGLGSTEDELKDQNNFMLVLKRIMGICSEPKSIDVSGTAKLSDLDDIDDSFFNPTNQEKIITDEMVNDVINGVMSFEDCDTIKFPINLKSTQISQNEIINEKNDNKKINLFVKYLNDTSNDPKNKKFSLNIKSSLETSIITEMPMVIFRTILTPKVLLGFFSMIKAIKNEISTTLDLSFDDLNGFMKTFKKFVLGFMKKLTAIFIEKLFSIVKKNIKLLVESILLEIVKESKIKKLRMYSTIVYALMVVGDAVIDYRNCKSVIDEILKLLNLGLSQFNMGLPPFILASASLLEGVSDTRSMANIIENLQSVGLPTGAAPDGKPNLMNIAISSIVKGQNKEVTENGKTEVFIPPLVITPAGTTLPNIGRGKSY